MLILAFEIIEKKWNHSYPTHIIYYTFLILANCAVAVWNFFAKEQDMHKEVPSAINLDSCVCVYEKLIDCKQAFDLLTFIQRVYCPSIREAGP